MKFREWRRRALAFGSAIAVAGLFVLVAPTAASADSLRPINISLTCTLYGSAGLPYGYDVTTGGALYEPPANGPSTVSGSTKTFYLLIPTTASQFGMETWCNGFIQNAVWQGYVHAITPGTSTVNASGYCSIYETSAWPGVTIVNNTCTLTSVTYS